MTLLCMCKGFSHLNEADDHDIIRLCQCHSAYVNEEVYKEVHMTPRGSFGSSFFGLFFSWFWLICPGSHRPSASATLVPLVEWDYHHTRKCSLFLHLYVLKFFLDTLS